jgi:hypothetical protein
MNDPSIEDIQIPTKKGHASMDDIEKTPVDSNNTDVQLATTIAPIIQEVVQHMNSCVRETMVNVRDMLADARKQEKEYLGQAVSSTIKPMIQDVLTDVCQHDTERIGHAISNTIGPIMRDVLTDIRHHDRECIGQAMACTMEPIARGLMGEMTDLIKNAMVGITGASTITNTDLNGSKTTTNIPSPINTETGNESVSVRSTQLGCTMPDEQHTRKLSTMENSVSVTAMGNSSQHDVAGQRDSKCRTRNQGENKRPHSHRTLPSTSSSSETEADDDNIFTISRHGKGEHNHSPKLPNFTGKDWKIWINRFEDVAHIQRWTAKQKLTEILPKLQGAAGEFVYGQLSRTKRNHYDTLVQELGYRFRTVETTRTYGSKFSNRNQRPGETVEEYAAEIKALYDKAYPNRDGQTRREDLLRRFLDGLLDERTQMQVEYVKEPADIDQAVYEVVNYLETRKRGKKDRDKSRAPIRMVRPTTDDSDTDGSDGDSDYDTRPVKTRIARAAAKVNKNKPIMHKSNEQTPADAKESEAHNTMLTHVISSNPHSKADDSITPIDSITSVMIRMEKCMNALESKCSSIIQPPTHNQGRESESLPGNQRRYSSRNGRPNNNPHTPPTNVAKTRVYNNQGGRAQTNNSICCFYCGEIGHYQRNCPSAPWVTGHMQMAVQPNIPPMFTTTQHITGSHPAPLHQLNNNKTQDIRVVSN